METKKSQKNGIVFFTLENTILKPYKSDAKASFGLIENGIKLLKSCASINHFAVVICLAPEHLREKVAKILQKSTNLVWGLDFEIIASPKETEPEKHVQNVVAHWSEYAAKQKGNILAGVSAGQSFLGIFSEYGIRPLFCSEDRTEADEFRAMTPEEIEAHKQSAANAEAQYLETACDPNEIRGDVPDVDYETEGDDISPEGDELPVMTGGEPSPDWQSDKIFDGDPAIEQAIQFPQYWKRLPTNWEFVDVYRVDELFPIELPGSSRLYHARKKLMVPGVRTGGKPAYKDIQEAVATLQGWLRDHAPRSDA